MRKLYYRDKQIDTGDWICGAKLEKEGKNNDT